MVQQQSCLKHLNVNVKSRQAVPAFRHLWYHWFDFLKVSLDNCIWHFGPSVGSFIKLRHHSLSPGLWRIPASLWYSGECTVGWPVYDCHLVVSVGHFKQDCTWGLESSSAADLSLLVAYIRLYDSWQPTATVWHNQGVRQRWPACACQTRQMQPNGGGGETHSPILFWRFSYLVNRMYVLIPLGNLYIVWVKVCK